MAKHVGPKSTILFAGYFLLAVILLLNFDDREPRIAFAQPECSSPWSKHKAPTEIELNAALAKHKEFLAQEQRDLFDLDTFLKADFCGADLRGFDLSNRDLRGIDFNGADLRGVNLSGANLGPVLFPVTMAGPVLVRTGLQFANLRGADLSKANLTDASLMGATLGITGRPPVTEYIGGTAGYSESEDIGCSENEVLARLAQKQTQIGDANLIDANLTGTRFEPDMSSLPKISGIAFASGLEQLDYCFSPYGLVFLREEFKKAGFDEQARKLTFAIRHAEVKKNPGYPSTALYWLFEYPCAWGLEPSAALFLLWHFTIIFSLPYMFALQFHSAGGIWKTWPADRVERVEEKIAPARLAYDSSTLQGWVQTIVVALYFSLCSSLAIGWHDLNLGSLLSRAQPNEFILRPTGWVRVVSGVQSGIGVYLVALWALTYFGHPFDY